MTFQLLIVFLAISSCVSDSPRIQPFNFAEDVKSEEATKVFCTVISGSKPLEFSWIKNGQRIKSNHPSIKIKTLDDFSVLIIDPVKIDHSGNYSCKVTNGDGSDISTASLIVKASPVWVEEPQSVEKALGLPLKIKCSVESFPKATLIWSILTKHFSLIEMKDGVLSFGALSRSDTGDYKCRADNGMGTIEKVIHLTVTVPAKIEDRYNMVTAKKGDSARLRCNATGDQPLALIWKKDKEQLSKAGNPRYEIFETLTTEGLESELVIRETERDDGAIYTCLAENGFGKDEKIVKLAVMEVPFPPTNVKVTDTWSRSAMITWIAPSNGNSPITQYIVQYWKDQGSSHRLHEQYVTSLQTSSLIGDLHPGTLYQLSVIAENAIGKGKPSRAIRFRTGEEEPNAAPVDVSAEPRGPTTIRVSWKPPPPDHWNGQLKGYYVGYKVHNSVQAYSYRTVDHASEGVHQYFLTQLLQGTEYFLIVKAFTAAGEGPPSSKVVIKTMSGELPESPIIYVLSTSPSVIKIGWTIKKSQVPVTGLLIHHRKENSPWQEGTQVPPTEVSYTFSSLEPGVSYQLYVTANNKYGKSDPSDIVTVRTDSEYGMAPMSSVTLKEGLPAYFHLSVLIPVVACIVAVVVVISVACVCVRRLRLDSLERGIMEEKQSMYAGLPPMCPNQTLGPAETLHRYADVENIIQPCEESSENIYPAPYATLPMRDDPLKEGLHQEMKIFFEKQNMKDRPLPDINQPGSSSMDTEMENIYDTAQ